MFLCPYGSLEVIQRAFGDLKLKSDERNQLSVQKTYEKTQHPKNSNILGKHRNIEKLKDFKVQELDRIKTVN